MVTAGVPVMPTFPATGTGLAPVLFTVTGTVPLTLTVGVLVTVVGTGLSG